MATMEATFRATREAGAGSAPDPWARLLETFPDIEPEALVGLSEDEAAELGLLELGIELPRVEHKTSRCRYCHAEFEGEGDDCGACPLSRDDAVDYVRAHLVRA